MPYIILDNITPPGRGKKSVDYLELEATIKSLRPGQGFLVDTKRKRILCLIIGKQLQIPIQTWTTEQGVMIYRYHTPSASADSPEKDNPHHVADPKGSIHAPPDKKKLGRPKKIVKAPVIEEPAEEPEEDPAEDSEEEPFPVLSKRDDDEDDEEDEADALLEEGIALDEAFERDEISNETYIAKQKAPALRQKAYQATR